MARARTDLPRTRRQDRGAQTAAPAAPVGEVVVDVAVGDPAAEGVHTGDGAHPLQVDAETASALKLWVVMSRAHAAIAAHAAAHVQQYGLTLAEFAILEALYHKGAMLLGEVQKRILVSSGGITFLVDRLTAKGLVERRQCESDRRARYAALTAEGTALIADIFPSHAVAIRNAVSGLTHAEREAAVELLRVVGRGAADRAAARPDT